MRFFKQKPTVKYYNLERLSHLWLAPNCVNESNLLTELVEKKWVYPETNNFWNKYIIPYVRQIQNQNLLILVQIVLEHLENNVSISSVNQDDSDFPETVKYHSQSISLLNHTLNVTKRAIEIIMDYPGDYKEKIPNVIISGLAHDIGLSIERHGLTHTQKGALWIENQLKGQEYDIRIIEAIKFHHRPGNEQIKKNPFLICLHQAENEIREKERENIKTEHIEEPFKKAETPFDESPSGFDETCTEKLPKDVEDESDEIAEMVDSETFLKRLNGEVSQNGFNAFYFENNVYVKPGVVKKILAEISGKNIEKDFERYVAQISTDLDAKSKRMRLKMHGKYPPLKQYYFILDASKMDIPDELINLAPRDSEGRFLKAVKIFN